MRAGAVLTIYDRTRFVFSDGRRRSGREGVHSGRRAVGSGMSVFADVRVPVSGYPLGEWLAERDDVGAEVERLDPLDRTPHYVWLTGPGREEVISELRRAEAARAVDAVDELPDRTLVRVEWEGLDSTAVGPLAEFDATVVALDGTTAGWRLQVRFPDREVLTRFYRACRERDLPVELGEVDDVDGAGADLGLTEAQRETLATALEAGYFDVPRRIALSELAETMGISDQAASERLRRGLRTLLATTITEDEPDTLTDHDRDTLTDRDSAG